MRLTWDRSADAAYLHLTERVLAPGRDTLDCPTPQAEGSSGDGPSVLMDWKDGRIVGLEVLAASTLLHDDLLATAEIIG